MSCFVIYRVDFFYFFFFSSRRRHTRSTRDWSSDVCSSDLGLAWDPTGTGTWAVRAGFGIHNDLQDNLANRTYSNPPYNAREQLTGSTLGLIDRKSVV